MKSIAYLSYYAQPGNPQKRAVTPAANTKIDYICDRIIKNGYSVELISASGTCDTKKGYKGSRVKLKNGLFLKTFNTLPWNNLFQKITATVITNVGIIRELLKIKRGEKIIAYHSLGYMRIVDILHKIKKFHLILEAEEIYADVIGNNKLKKKEIKFLKSGDSYIFPTELLNKIINTKNKPAVIIHGTYKVEPEKEKIFSDNKIHIVYAGTFDPRKGGISAVSAAEFLPSNYHIHIIGFGSEQDTNNIKRCIDEISKKSKATVTYDGIYSGEEYIKFIQSCDIGLSTQNPNADFNATSFPSKILSYMANGLRVVSIRIPAIETSAIGKYMYYYDEQTPKQIAKAIMSVDLSGPFDSRKIIRKLSNDFTKELDLLLSTE